MINYVGIVLALLIILLAPGCGKKTGADAASKADCSKTAVVSADACDACCKKNGHSTSAYMSAFMTGGDPVCECR